MKNLESNRQNDDKQRYHIQHLIFFNECWTNEIKIKKHLYFFLPGIATPAPEQNCTESVHNAFESQ